MWSVVCNVFILFLLDSILSDLERWEENPCPWNSEVQFTHFWVKYFPAYALADGKDLPVEYQTEHGELREKELCSFHSLIKNNHRSSKLLHYSAP